MGSVSFGTRRPCPSPLFLFRKGVRRGCESGVPHPNFSCLSLFESPDRRAILLSPAKEGRSPRLTPSSSQPGLLLIIVLGILTTYGDYVLGQFALEYPGIHSVSDIGYIMGGVVGREIFAASYAIFM